MTTAGALTEFSVPTAGANPYGITQGPDGNVWFTEYSTAAIGRITTAGVVTEFAVPTGASAPLMITPGTDGNLWFTEYASSKIWTDHHRGRGHRISSERQPLGHHRRIGQQHPLVHRGDQQQGRIHQSDQRLHGRGRGVSDADGEQWTARNHARSRWERLVRGGRIDKIGRVNTTTAMFTEFVVPTAGAVPAQIVTGPDNNLWFTEEIANRIGRLAP